MFRVSLSVLFVLLVVTSTPADGDPKAVSYEKDILPLFKARCYSCHDARKGTAGLRLDVRSRAQAGGESGAKSIVPGKSAESEVLKRVTAADDDEKLMPPSGDRLTKDEIAKLRAWIDAGASWPDALANEPAAVHWGFVPPKRPELPKIPDPKLDTKHPIDAFIRARLAKEGLTPSTEADPVTLCRRLYLDLLGLPPTPQEVDSFLNDKEPGAYERLVDKLLASPHYGERWGRIWLDAARYADSDGFEKDKPRFVWFYREWVIRAFNQDMPYDRFIIEQIAGDLLPNPTQDQLVATGYLRNSMINEEGGIDPEQFRMEAMFDRMDAIGKGVLGLTIQCAQCHTHKYDPISHKEYYELFAFLNNAHEASATVYTAEEQMKRNELFKKIQAVEDELKHKMPNWPEQLSRWALAVSKNQTPWQIVRPELDTSGGQKHTLLADGSVLAGGYAPTKGTYDFTGPTELTEIAAARLEALPDPTLPRGGPGRSIYGLFALTEFKLEVMVDGKAKPVKIASATANAESAERPLEPAFDDRSNRKRIVGGINFAIDGKDETAWSPDIGWGRSNVAREAVFTFAEPIQVKKGSQVTFKLVLNHGGWNSDDNQTNNLGRFRLSLTDAKSAKADPLPAAVRNILSIPPEKRSDAQRAVLFSHWRTTVPAWKDANTRIEELWKEHPPGTSQLVLKERLELRDTHLLKRGDFLQPGDSVEPGTPKVLHPFPPGAPKDRLGFARWLVDRNSPTTARSFVNRVWQAYFGAGLVTTPEDFGTQAAAPTHPELLDWLAVEFMSPTPEGERAPQAWSIKNLHRLIVTSATYRQSSRVTPELLQKDPANRLLARGARFRVDAEIVRDVALAASGLLDRRLGGTSVYPPIPAFLMLPPASYGPKVWAEDIDSSRYRRSLYVFSFRSVPYPPLAIFDAPNGDFACVKRTRSNTPLQALTMMNEPIFLEAAQALARRVLIEGGKSDAERIRHAFRLVTARFPVPAETGMLLELLNKQREKFSTPESDPWAVAFRGNGEYRKLPHTATPADAAAWTTVARVLLNLDETVTKE